MHNIVISMEEKSQPAIPQSKRNTVSSYLLRFLLRRNDNIVYLSDSELAKQIFLLQINNRTQVTWTADKHKNK